MDFWWVIWIGLSVGMLLRLGCILMFLLKCGERFVFRLLIIWFNSGSIVFSYSLVLVFVKFE